MHGEPVVLVRTGGPVRVGVIETGTASAQHKGRDPG
ncbi:hypothetical protein SAZ_01615 [Streptomyces noursei ZPM]|nr:hypothetical protein SAZ_01615 [Streptomyces noursei ZPM]EPY92676.1 hypothetical protein K530_51855 [Streptomyces noursei CCRC 11814]